LTAEEVPRWFGLSVVLINFVGLMTVGQYALSATRIESAAQFHQNSAYSVKLLADRLGAMDTDTSNVARWSSYGRILKEFAVNISAKTVRVVVGTDRRVACSTDASESGRVSSVPGEAVEGLFGMETFVLPQETGQERTWMVRAPINVRAARQTHAPTLHEPEEKVSAAASPAANGGGAEPISIEAVFLRVPGTTHHWLPRAATLGIVLMVLGALFLTYRCLREQLRGVSRIAHRLESHRDRLEQEIGALRIGDEQDSVTQSWNQLVDMTQGLLQSSREKKADEELTRVLQRSGGGALADALHALPDGIIHIVDESRLDYLNSTACRLMGWKPQDGRRPLLNEAKADGAGAKILDLIRASLQPEGRFESRVELMEVGDAAQGDQSSYRVWLLPMQGPRHTGECLVVIRDVSQQLRAEKAREEFIAQVTHEFRTPLTNIRAYTETLSSGMFEDPQVISECYNVITKETRRLSRLIEDILSVSQLEVGSIELRTDNVDLRTLLTEGVRDVRGLAEEKTIDVQLVLPAKLETIQGDRDKLAVVVNNLLGNAIKYTPPGGNVVVGCQVSADSVVITVKDNGLGISARDQTRVFEKFQRGSDPAIQNITGTGIGLFTAREIVRRHGGDIELISEKGAGSTFMARLPHRESRGSAMTTAPTGGEHG
jgi:signal transduction histidine kinase